MKKLFIHHPLFRLLSPLFSGVIAYLFILLINNNVEQLQEQFLSQELYVCIGLSFVIQELSRLLLIVFNKWPSKFPTLYAVAFQVVASLLLCALAVSITIHIYYNKTLGYSPNIDELLLFNTIFCTITLIYILLHLSHQYLHKVNTKKLNEELVKKQLIEADFIEFKNAINPDLLFNSLESIIALLKDDKEKIDDLIDHMASTYRYILSQGQRQLTNLKEELHVLNELINLFSYLPYRRIKLDNAIKSSFLIVPGSLLNVVEYIVKHSISSIQKPLMVTFSETNSYIEIAYRYDDKIIHPFREEDFKELIRVYGIYSTDEISIKENQGLRTIALPKLYLKE